MHIHTGMEFLTSEFMNSFVISAASLSPKDHILEDLQALIVYFLGAKNMQFPPDIKKSNITW